MGSMRRPEVLWRLGQPDHHQLGWHPRDAFGYTFHSESQKCRNTEGSAWIASLGDNENEEDEVEQLDENGNLEKRKVDLAILDLTDLENKCFIHPI
ncbi:uncharacterized protein A1O9_04180 [Exophiala aquamarina CBS 119918]|uniref:Uncharacterized protein n=1 Tax=Exophiala aquamarina CBS 119918 TaxID=1182545 RepID=A0A072PHL2_9EURO|nr:uncharacterized protein A1O9_04180 [Exophiala aquamarina CBS 119918]KEF59336.1 hypothetical protein A1O9_04180 [Exophiala aquamarina CBS 119918]